MIVLMCQVSSAIMWYLRIYMPSNILLDRLRTRRRLKWSVPVALVLVLMYLFAASFVMQVLASGGPGWLNVLVMIWTWNALKFASMAVLTPLIPRR